METINFEMIVKAHSLFPNNNLYNSNALCGEVGEVANQVKKLEIALARPDWVLQNENSLPDASHFREAIIDELGDVLFYLTRVALDQGITLERIMNIQFQKLVAQSDKYQRTFLK
jgi:NTP pyrophosphatase (non-canonical NTP hydrolase)